MHANDRLLDNDGNKQTRRTASHDHYVRGHPSRTQYCCQLTTDEAPVEGHDIVRKSKVGTAGEAGGGGGGEGGRGRKGGGVSMGSARRDLDNSSERRRQDLQVLCSVDVDDLCSGD